MSGPWTSSALATCRAAEPSCDTESWRSCVSREVLLQFQIFAGSYNNLCVVNEEIHSQQDSSVRDCRQSPPSLQKGISSSAEDDMSRCDKQGGIFQRFLAQHLFVSLYFRCNSARTRCLRTLLCQRPSLWKIPS